MNPRRGFAALVLAGALCACGHDVELARAASPPPPMPAPLAATYRVEAPVPPRVPRAPTSLVASLDLLVRSFDGKVGVAVKSVDDGWTAQANGDIRLPQQSVSKLWVAMTVLDMRDAGRLRLDDPIVLTRDDLTLFHQPVAALIKGDGYHTTVGGLLQRALTMSDNTCNDRLLRYVGGPAAVRDFIARKGLGDIRFGPGEKLLQSGTAGLSWRPEFTQFNAFERARAALPPVVRASAFDGYIANPPDGAAPAAIAGALAKLKRGELLSPDSTAYLIGTMESSRTGKQRMRGAVLPGWTFGHKTGTGQDFLGRTAGYNDVGLLTAPDGRTYAIAVMIGETHRSIPERQALMQSVVASVIADDRFAGGSTYRTNGS
ncbi:MAG: class A beta-lactamase-related serine hydrolase [Pseudomonadota bacterium]|nr:class A beta-lactamase-related serine hydrolase [Pseudomonadota bacterium]